jgi:hypothetical protein
MLQTPSENKISIKTSSQNITDQKQNSSWCDMQADEGLQGGILFGSFWAWAVWSAGVLTTAAADVGVVTPQRLQKQLQGPMMSATSTPGRQAVTHLTGQTSCTPPTFLAGHTHTPSAHGCGQNADSF